MPPGLIAENNLVRKLHKMVCFLLFYFYLILDFTKTQKKILYMNTRAQHFCPFLTKGRNSKIVILSNESKRDLCKPYQAIGVRLIFFTAEEGI